MEIKDETEHLLAGLRKCCDEMQHPSTYKSALRRSHIIFKRFAEIGDGALDYLYPFLSNNELRHITLQVLRNIKSEKSIPRLIEFLRNADTDEDDERAEAMFALKDIGAPAVEPLIKAIKEDFEKGRVNAYFIEALTKIKDGRVHSFVIEIVENCPNILLERNEIQYPLLQILREMKSEKSIPFLIEFLKKNDDGDRWDENEEAMFALNEIGAPAVDLLIKQLRGDFENKKFRTYLAGALTGIKDERAYSFMAEIVEDYIAEYGKYEGWFRIDAFVIDFPVQGKKEILLLLNELLEKEYLTEDETIEIEDAIDRIEHPEDYEDDVNEWLEPIRQDEIVQRHREKVGRNDPCPCGSGKKYKKCCLKREMYGS